MRAAEHFIYIGGFIGSSPVPPTTPKVEPGVHIQMGRLFWTRLSLRETSGVSISRLTSWFWSLILRETAI